MPMTSILRSPAYVRNSQAIVCRASIFAVDAEAKSIRDWVRETKLFIGFSVRKFDTAKSRLACRTELPIIGQASRSQMQQTVNMFISKRVLVLGHEKGVFEVPLPALSVPTNSTTASAVLNCLDRSPQSKESRECASEILKHADLAAELDGEDGAFSNKKYEAFRTMMPDSHAFPRGVVDCGDHESHHTDQLIEELHNCRGSMVVSRTTGFLNFMRSANFYIRLVASIFVVVSDTLNVIDDYAPEGDGEFWAVREEHAVFFL